METRTIKTVSDELKKAIEAEKAQREKYFAHIATFMKGSPKLKGARLIKTLKSCPPKTYRKAAAA